MTNGSNPDEGLPKKDVADVANIIQQLEDLVKLALECENKELKPGVSFVEIHKKLLAIQMEIQRFQEGYHNQLARYNLTPEDVKPTPEELERLDPKERKVLEKLQYLKTVCEEARDRFYESMQADKETLKQVRSELEDKGKDKLRRKGKFKGMGGKEGWIPT